METLLTVNQLTDAVKGQLFSKASDLNQLGFTQVQTDSRNVKENTLFVPLIGEFQDGHKYVPQAVEKGASVVFIQKDEYAKNVKVYEDLLDANKNLCFITVENTLHALQNAAEAYVAKFPSLVKISITGSCGKTTTKEMLVSVFKAKYQDKVVYTQGNFNSETGLPLSVFNIRANHEYGIFEMGMNRENEIGEISKVLKSEYGIITNIGNAHIGLLGSRENIAKEKRKSLDYISKNGAAFIPFDDDFADYCCQNVKGKIVKYGPSVDSKISGVEYLSDEGLFGTLLKIDGVQVKLGLSGIHNYVNALGVIALAKECGIETEYIQSGLENMAKLSGRMEIEQSVLSNEKKVVLVKDCYNANPDSMEKVIEFVGGVNNVNQKIFVLADMKELGDQAKTGHEAIGKALNNISYSKVILVGQDMAYAKGLIKSDSVSYYAEKSDENYNQICKEILDFTKDGDVVVFKGSHSMELEKIVDGVVKNEK